MKFIFVYGPPGSGKTYFINNILKNKDNYVILSIDDMLLELPEYKTEIDECKQKFSADDNVSAETAEHCQNLFHKYYKEVSVLFTERYNDAISNKKNIIIELTGRNVSRFTHEKNILSRHPDDYTFELVYPLVPTDVLIQRVKDRSKITGRYVSPENIKIMKDQAQTNFVVLVPYMDKIKLYDENNKIIFKLKKTCNIGPNELQHSEPLVALLKSLCRIKAQTGGGTGNNILTIILFFIIICAIICLIVYIVLTKDSLFIKKK